MPDFSGSSRRGEFWTTPATEEDASPAIVSALRQLGANAESPFKLAVEVREKGPEGVAIVRAPDPTEPELVGPG